MQFATEKCSEILQPDDLLSRIVVTVEAKFHISGRVIQHTVRSGKVSFQEDI